MKTLLCNSLYCIPTNKEQLIAYLVIVVFLGIFACVMHGHDLPPKEW